ncbi:hypothetical protein [Streptomyces sp. NPDC001275]
MAIALLGFVDACQAARSLGEAALHAKAVRAGFDKARLLFRPVRLKDRRTADSLPP